MITGNYCKILYNYIVYYIVIFLLSSSQLYSQQYDFIKSIFSSSDLKKLEKTKSYELQAEQLIEEANELYMETFAVQGDYELDEDKIEKKVKQLENNAQKKQIEAAQYYELINQTKFGIYKRYIEKFWSDFEGDESSYVNARLIEEQSNDLYFQASTLRSEASKISDQKEKVENLNNAYNLEIRAHEKQLSALAIYYGIEYTPAEKKEEQVYTDVTKIEEPQEAKSQQMYYRESVDQEAELPPARDITISEPTRARVKEDVMVNQMIIDLYNQYISDETRYPATVLTPEILSGITYFDSDQIHNIWYSYAFDTLYEGVPAPPPEQLAVTDTVFEELAYEETAEEELVPEQYEEKIAVVEEDVGESYHVPEGEEVIYRVQIAANKIQLTQRALSKIYYGNKAVEMINEEGWFKYSIGDFYTYGDADKFRKQCGVKNAFIVAYRKGQKFIPSSLSEEIAAQYSQTAEDIIASRYDIGLMFRVQIAANRVPLTKEQLSRIYTDDYPVEMIEEEGWFKYQILGVRLFSDALRILRSARVKGAFIVAYNNGVMQNLYIAVKHSKTLEQEIQIHGRKGRLNDIEWHVQIAASRIPLTTSELSKIYRGNYKISLIIEEGWYKYRLKAGSSYSAAKEIKQQCGVPKAFIVPYYRAKKVPIDKAINDYY
jgi:hypothetical protein